MDNINNYKLVVDVDGTLCPIKKTNEEYIDLKPNMKMVEKLREYHKQGVSITIFSSRNMRTYDSNLGLINKNTAPVLLEWLKKWDIPFDEILLGKPWPGHKGFYIDDRSVRPDEFVKYDFNQLDEICENSKKDL